MTAAPYSFLAHMEAVSDIKATPKSIPEATRPRISEPCKWAASIRGLPKLLSRTIVPMNAAPRPASRLPFFISPPKTPKPVYILGEGGSGGVSTIIKTGFQ
jgi:hypothetical protein